MSEHDHIHIGTGPRVPLPPQEPFSCLGCGQPTDTFQIGSLVYSEIGLCERCTDAIRARPSDETGAWELRIAARNVMLRLIAEHGHAVSAPPQWPSCRPTHDAIKTLRAALANHERPRQGTEL